MIQNSNLGKYLQLIAPKGYEFVQSKTIEDTKDYITKDNCERLKSLSSYFVLEAQKLPNFTKFQSSINEAIPLILYQEFGEHRNQMRSRLGSFNSQNIKESTCIHNHPKDSLFREKNVADKIKIMGKLTQLHGFLESTNDKQIEILAQETQLKQRKSDLIDKQADLKSQLKVVEAELEELADY